MANRLNNDFQFVDVGRQDPQKKPHIHVPKSSLKFTNPLSPPMRRVRRTVACTAAIRTASGSARYITTFPTGFS